MIRRGEIWWASLQAPRGSEPGYRRPILVVQDDAFNRSKVSTVLAVVLTSNLELGAAPGNVVLTRRQSKLPRESVVNVSQVVTLDKSFLKTKVGTVSAAKMQDVDVDAGLRLVLGL